jgi:UDP-N-acetyl-D-mannosaminuronic acid transferase (WecB/TagA/CpsF family)
MLLMNAAGERLTAIAQPKVGGFPFHDLDWDKALSLAENLTRFPGGQSGISFLDTGLIARCLFMTSERRALARQLVLPAGGVLSGLLFRMMGARSTSVRFPAARFIPALLTYSERPMTIAVLHAEAGEAERFRERLQQHAPWHNVIVAADGMQGRCDLMIAMGRHARARAMPQRIKANLTIFADAGLPGLGE